MNNLRTQLKKQLIRKLKDELNHIYSIVSSDFILIYICQVEGLANVYDTTIQNIINDISTSWGKIASQNSKDLEYFSRVAVFGPAGTLTTEDLGRMGNFFLTLAVNRKLMAVYSRYTLDKMILDPKLKLAVQNRKNMFKISKL